MPHEELVVGLGRQAGFGRFGTDAPWPAPLSVAFAPREQIACSVELESRDVVWDLPAVVSPADSRLAAQDVDVGF